MWYVLFIINIQPKRGVRVVDGAILEGSCGGNSTVGSNPISSEKAAEHLFQPFF